MVEQLTLLFLLLAGGLLHQSIGSKDTSRPLYHGVDGLLGLVTLLECARPRLQRSELPTLLLRSPQARVIRSAELEALRGTEGAMVTDEIRRLAEGENFQYKQVFMILN